MCYKMKFNNKENERIILPDGRIIWLSRACAVVITVWCIVENTPYLLLGKRGCGCPDEVGKWNLPCGYLDWDETLSEAAEREVFEETGVDIRSVQQGRGDTIINNHMNYPWKISSSINGRKNTKQNISHHFALVYKADELAELSTAHCEPDEVSDLKWITQDEINDFDYAFNHLEVIWEFLDKGKVLL
ncbi:MAG TPA: NUDIX hydrolase [Leucothrix mucor]|uniref:NUDIX hydrolase n=1 Tax=Leucothrix mucor TaxID=45248 RepID=A0A7V2T0S9_LEUMU|nr:NUDIX hydrolase [Leucothrix mucor]